CKPDSHATLYERLAFWQANDGMTEREVRHWNGRFTEVTRMRYINDVRLRGGDDALPVNWCEITVVNAKTGEQLYHNSCITNHRLQSLHLRPDSRGSIAYSEELISSTISVTLQSTDRHHGIVGQERCHN